MDWEKDVVVGVGLVEESVVRKKERKRNGKKWEGVRRYL